MKCRITAHTWLKQDTRPASQLIERFKLSCKPGTELDVIKAEWAPSGHIRITLLKPNCGFQTWLVYGDHCDCEGLPTQNILLNVPYYSQRDNTEQWWRTCNTSSCAMAAEFLKPGCCHGSDDWFWRHCVNPAGDTTDHSAMTVALRKVGIESEFHYDLSYADLDRELEAGRPVVIGVLHRGTLANPAGGHMICCIGRTQDGYLFHDPWGAGFSYDSHNGKSVEYPRQSLDARWLAGDISGGWGRVFKG